MQSTGTIRYSPPALGESQGQNWWIIVDCQAEIGKYYRQLYKGFHWNCRELKKPAWAEHISVGRNEEPPNKEFWEKYNGQTVDFTYTLQAQTDGVYCWLPVQCDFLLDLRVELGLPREPEFPLHLTFGLNFEGQDGLLGLL